MQIEQNKDTQFIVEMLNWIHFHPHLVSYRHAEERWGSYLSDVIHLGYVEYSWAREAIDKDGKHVVTLGACCAISLTPSGELLLNSMGMGGERKI